VFVKGFKEAGAFPSEDMWTACCVFSTGQLIGPVADGRESHCPIVLYYSCSKLELLSGRGKH